MPNDLVGYSRAGDTFHYRWAARRCLRMVYPNSQLETVVVEGSKEPDKEGQYVIDVSEYYQDTDGNKKIEYYQLKHSTLHAEDAFTLSDLKVTFEGFAKIFKNHLISTSESFGIPFNFTIVTNRKVADSFKENVKLLSEGKPVTEGFNNTITSYTGLDKTSLEKFCKHLHFQDSEGDYKVQQDELRLELGQLMAGAVDNTQLTTLTGLIEDKILPHENGIIIREDVLRQFKTSFIKDLYPAPSVWEPLDKVILRDQHTILINKITNSTGPTIIHAAGGVGKSVFCRQFVKSTEEGSITIAYDCFAAGIYRNRSNTRHRHRDALVQIANELATKSLCEPLIELTQHSDEDIMKSFISRLESALQSIKKNVPTGKLYILIDAADNAEMAAQEFNQSCFANELLRESFSRDCKLIFLCRTERIDLLKPNYLVNKLELTPFSETESFSNLKNYYENADEDDGKEFHRLTGGNPRVQANSLSIKFKAINELLQSLGPTGTTVDDQIKFQLNTAVEKMKDALPPNFNEHIYAICTGLACLPPNIPIKILAQAASIDTNKVISFISDIGRPLWMSDASVQFRDEPTETWFRETFTGSKEKYSKYIDNLEPLAEESTYVAETLPQLYLLAEQYEKLIRIALSDTLLPSSNPIDARNVRVYRLQFAFKAALKVKKFKDAIQLAMRAGEEVAGDLRQMRLLTENVDLLVALQDKEKIQEIAYKRKLKGHWEGSENLYAASLLSSVSDFKGEARGYLRTAQRWLNLYFKESKKEETSHHNQDLQDRDLVEFAFTYLNLVGVQEALWFLNSLSPKRAMFSVMRDFISRLIDKGEFDIVFEFLKECERDHYFTVAIVSELMKVGVIPDSKYLRTTLQLLTLSKCRIERGTRYYYEDYITQAIISFLEACLSRELSDQEILRAVRYYVPIRGTEMISSNHDQETRSTFIRCFAIRAIISKTDELDIDSIVPSSLINAKKDHKVEAERKKYIDIINGLYPWYLLRAKVLCNKSLNLTEASQSTFKQSEKARSSRYGDWDTLPHEISRIATSIVIYGKNLNKEEIERFYRSYIEIAAKFSFPDRINFLRAVFRLNHLDFLKSELENKVHEIVKNNRSDATETVSGRYIGLARAIVNKSIDDAGVYFDEAIKIASKFGDEIVERWLAMSEMAKVAALSPKEKDQLAYRYIRCAEVVGEDTEDDHWNRKGSIALCTRLSPGIGISALSRWRERDKGYFDELLISVIKELVSSEKITSAVAWSLTRFTQRHSLNELMEICLKKEIDNSIKDKIVQDAIEILQIEGCSEFYWKKLRKIATNSGVSNNTLERILDFYSEQPKESTDSKSSHGDHIQKDFQEEWDKVFKGINLASVEGLNSSHQRYKLATEISRFGYYNEFWKEVIKRVAIEEYWNLIDSFLLADFTTVWDIKNFYDCLPDTFKNKVSFIEKWPEILNRIGNRFASELSYPSTFASIVNNLKIDYDKILSLKQGIFNRLSEHQEFNSASEFFGFADLASELLSPDDALMSLDYSLSRFEQHIDPEFGDGVWEDWLKTDGSMHDHIAGFIWSALAAPSRATRWQAAHVVRLLGKFNATAIFESLIRCLEDGTVKSFGVKAFPFYNLHARLYLLTSFARISKDNPMLFVDFAQVFPKYALQPHALIQKCAKELIIALENSSPGIYSTEIFQQVNLANTYNKKAKKIQFNQTIRSYWHTNNLLVPVNESYHFGWDFDHYWFDPLGRVFGVNGKEVEQVAEQVIVHEWNVQNQASYTDDPRHYLWNRHSGDRETWHDHFSYPRADNMNFYYSYHSLFVAAAKFLEKMPVVTDSNYITDSWEDWIDSHIVTRNDGFWLSDLRDPLPLKRPKWIGKNAPKDWRVKIKDDDFENNLILKDIDETWLVVSGSWSEANDYKKETFTVSTALVGKKASNALLHTLSAIKNPYDYKLPDYEERDHEINSKPFVLKGWFEDLSISLGIDQFDPYANEIGYPPKPIGDNIMKKLKISVDSFGKLWSYPQSNLPVIISELWKSFRHNKDDEFDQSGIRAKATVSFLKYLCKTLNCDLIFDVGISRDLTSRYSGDNYEYLKPKHKIFIFSSDGTFKDAKRSYRVG